jgi:hypothetical protein
VPTFRTAEVTELIAERTGLQRVRVRMPDGSAARAYALTQLVGECAVGDAVVVNTTAVELDLGTGGWHFVHWNLARDEFVSPGPEHIMKLRYTSLQFDAGTDELTHPECDRPLDGLPVVVCSVHSQMATVALAIADAAPGTRVAYVMTDGGALPLALSDLVHSLREGGLLVGTVTAGHAFGGDREAVSMPSALAIARHALDAEVVVAGMGLGGVGTGSRLGYSGLEQAQILDAATWLGGRPIVCVRASSGDARPRHQGVSHHTTTVLEAVRAAVDVPVPAGLDLDLPARHQRVEVEDPGAATALEAADLRVTTMGRGPDQDPLFFEAAGAAGVHAATLLSG